MNSIFFCHHCQDFFISWGEPTPRCSGCNQAITRDKGVFVKGLVRTDSQFATDTLSYIKSNRPLFLSMVADIKNLDIFSRKKVDAQYLGVFND